MLKKIKKLWTLNRKIRFMTYSRGRIERYQWRKLKAIIAHAYTTVPYYRDLFSRHHLKPEDIHGFRDFKKIPLTSKKDIVALDRIRITSDAVAPEDRYEMRTSGSTGEPFRFFLDTAYGEQVGLDCIRSKRLHGLRPTDKILRIGGDESQTEPSGSRIRNLFLQKATLSSFSTPEEILEYYQRFRPDVIRGFLSNLYVFAVWLEENRIRLDHSPRFILCSAEMAHDFMRDKVSEAFRARVLDRYATAELGVVADNCEQGGGYHIFEDSVYAEFLEVNGATCFVGTNLDNYATPFIRYNTFDVCEPWPDAPGRCTCGLGTTKFRRITGRDNDFIVRPDGGMVAPMELIFTMRKSYRSVKKYRFVQEDRRTLQVDIVEHDHLSNKTIKAMATDLKILTGGLRPEIQIVDHIPLEASGKMRIVRSNLKGRINHEN